MLKESPEGVRKIARREGADGDEEETRSLGATEGGGKESARAQTNAEKKMKDNDERATWLDATERTVLTQQSGMNPSTS